jgi:PIN domain nuclease of toxin-antitoxin system
MLIAQAPGEDFILVTRDENCQKYDVALLPV